MNGLKRLLRRQHDIDQGSWFVPTGAARTTGSWHAPNIAMRAPPASVPVMPPPPRLVALPGPDLLAMTRDGDEASALGRWLEAQSAYAALIDRYPSEPLPRMKNIVALRRLNQRAEEAQQRAALRALVPDAATHLRLWRQLAGDRPSHSSAYCLKVGAGELLGLGVFPDLTPAQLCRLTTGHNRVGEDQPPPELTASVEDGPEALEGVLNVYRPLLQAHPEWLREPAARSVQRGNAQCIELLLRHQAPFDRDQLAVWWVGVNTFTDDLMSLASGVLASGAALHHEGQPVTLLQLIFLHPTKGIHCRQVRWLLQQGHHLFERAGPDSDVASPARLLLQLGVSTLAQQIDYAKLPIQEQDPDGGNTLLHEAVLLQQRDCVDLLLRHGADQTVRNHDGHTPCDLARSAEHCGLVHQFEQFHDVVRLVRHCTRLARRGNQVMEKTSLPPLQRLDAAQFALANTFLPRIIANLHAAAATKHASSIAKAIVRVNGIQFEVPCIPNYDIMEVLAKMAPTLAQPAWEALRSLLHGLQPETAHEIALQLKDLHRDDWPEIARCLGQPAYIKTSARVDIVSRSLRLFETFGQRLLVGLDALAPLVDSRWRPDMLKAAVEAMSLLPESQRRDMRNWLARHGGTLNAKSVRNMHSALQQAHAGATSAPQAAAAPASRLPPCVPVYLPWELERALRCCADMQGEALILAAASAANSERVDAVAAACRCDDLDRVVDEPEVAAAVATLTRYVLGAPLLAQIKAAEHGTDRMRTLLKMSAKQVHPDKHLDKDAGYMGSLFNAFRLLEEILLDRSLGAPILAAAT